jgi:pterin-4a-carbinolamine dehydratase
MKPERIQEARSRLPLWVESTARQKLMCDFVFPTFHDGVRFINFISRQAANDAHHLELMVRDNHMRVAVAGEKDLTAAQLGLATSLGEEWVKRHAEVA